MYRAEAAVVSTITSYTFINKKRKTNCGRQEEPAMLISKLLLRMRCMYMASIPFDFH